MSEDSGCASEQNNDPGADKALQDSTSNSGKKASSSSVLYIPLERAKDV